MKTSLLLLVFSCGFFSACSQTNHLERIQTQAPADKDIVGTYSIIEETASGRSLEQTRFKTTRVDIAAGGTLRFTEFPIFSDASKIRGIFTTINEPGRWIITSDQRGYSMTLIREYGDRLHAILTEGGNPTDMILYFGPRENGVFVKLRKI